MDIQNYYELDDEALIARIRSLPREALEEQARQFGVQYALICQRLEALYTPDRLNVFIAIRPGGLAEIDKAIALCGTEQKRERILLQSFRELNRVLLPFMDVFEAQQLADLKHMGRDELETLLTGLSKHLETAKKQLELPDPNFRDQQNASGTLRLAQLLQDGIRRELKERFGVDPG